MKRSQQLSRWAYFYQLASSLDEQTLASISQLLVRENALARRRRPRWIARLVIEDGHARILVVCESLTHDRKVNRRLEAHLRWLGTEFSVSVPMAIADDITPIIRARRDPD